jgi:hypothetical protein
MLPTMINFHKAMTKLGVADDAWRLAEKNYDSIVWVSESKVTKEEWDGAVSELQTELVAQEYARNRRTEYDALNQFELISDDTINGTTTHKDAIEAIKAKYPKP